jgi:hypothetical protein
LLRWWAAITEKSRTRRYWQKVDEGKQDLFESAVARPVGALHPGVVEVQKLEERDDPEDVHSRT